MATTSTSAKSRKYPRQKAPKGMSVGWKCGGHSMESRADTIGMGGLFLHTVNPPPPGSVIELLFDLDSGEIRARANVRDSIPGKGMGVQFVQMETSDRARLNQFLVQHVKLTGKGERGRGEAKGEQLKPVTKGKRSLQRDKTRSVRRCTLVASAEVIELAEGARLSGRITELGVGGCYVDTLNPFPEGTLLKIRISRDQGTFEAQGRVAYCHAASGMGIAFTEIAPDQRTLLEEWLAEIIVRDRPTV